MTPREAGQLLGGYATGTLTDAERKLLFAAALEDQALFDALADEEALRELLADAGTRARLLALLAEPARKPAVPLWRRPASLGLAASILAAVGVGLSLRHGPAPEAARVHAPVLAEEPPKAAAPSQKAVEAPQPFMAAKKPSITKPSPRMEHAPAAPPPPAAVAVVASAAGNQAAPAPLHEKAEARRAPEPPPAEAGVSAAGAMAYSPGVALDASKATPPPAPVWTLEDDGAQRLKITIRWGPGGYLYLLQRTTARTEVFRPDPTTPESGGRSRTVFIVLLKEGESLDLYQLSQPAPHPEALPAEGPIAGFRRRVWPAGEKAP